TRSPQTTGEDQPRPGTSAFQRTFLLVSQVSGGSAPWATPAAGPRNCGPLSAARPAAAVSEVRSTASSRARYTSRVLASGPGEGLADDGMRRAYAHWCR